MEVFIIMESCSPAPKTDVPSISIQFSHFGCLVPGAQRIVTWENVDNSPIASPLVNQIVESTLGI